MDAQRPLRTYGRTKARTLKPRQAGLMHALLPHLSLDLEAPLDLEALFGAPGPRALEIGFGGGEHLVAQAAAQPEAGFIGVEPFMNGVASCLRHIEESGVTNVRLHMGDGRDVVSQLPDASLDVVYILFPDPWPKARHHKRRLIQVDFVGELARVLKAGGEVRFSTDWADYAEWTLWRFSRDAGFEWAAECAENWRVAWPGHSATRYEQKRLGDCAPVWLRFLRR